MPDNFYDYIIVGGGLAGVSGARGIREIDRQGSIKLFGRENYLPYDRPPLTKGLWFGKKKLEKIFIEDKKFYEENNVDLTLCTGVEIVDPVNKEIRDSQARVYRFGKLLLATGGLPRRLPIPGGELNNIYYYRYLDDYISIRRRATEGKSAVVVGGGFIGSEIAAALNTSKVEVTMIFPESYLAARVFPEYLGKALQARFMEKGIKVINGDKPAAFAQDGEKVVIHTASGKKIESDILIVGVGIAPEAGLAQNAGLNIKNGIAVNEYLQTSQADIYAAGDNAFFPYQALGIETRIEHWDNALNQGVSAGRNMAGAHEVFNYMPYFFSDLFEFGYEAVGEINSSLETFADWQKENDTGVIYYLKESKVHGVMMCNVWKKVEAARQLIKKGEKVTGEILRGLIR